MADDMGGFERIGPVKVPDTKADDMGGFERIQAPPFMEGVGTGLLDKAYGAAQLGARGVIDVPPIGFTDEQAAAVAPERQKEQVAAVDKTVGRRERQLEKEGFNKGWGRTAGNVIGDVAVTAPLSLIPGAAPLSWLGRIGQGLRLGALGGTVGSATQPDATPGKVAVGTAAGGFLGGAVGGLSKAIASNSPAEVESFIKSAYNRAIKPPVAGKTTASQLDRYEEQTRSAISSIIENKPNLRFTDEAGETVGALPRTIEQFGDAIEQTKQGIFQRYDAMARQAGEQGAKVELGPTIDELNKIAADPVVRTLHPELVDYAAKRAEALTAQGSWATPDAQRAVQNLNTSLKSFYRNPSYEMAARASVDSLIANKLREGLDTAIETAVAPGYQALKNQYGSLKTIEKDVLHRAVVEGRKNLGGGLMGNIGDVVSAEEVLRGVMTLSPKTVATGAALKAFTMYTKYLRDPNRAVTKLFEAAEKPPAASLPVTRYVAPLVGGAAAAGVPHEDDPVARALAQ